MKTKFTPGPWKAEGRRIRQAESGAVIAQVGPAFGAHADERIAANAAAIAALPDLVAALRDAYGHIATKATGQPTAQSSAEVLEVIGAALAKVNGE